MKKNRFNEPQKEDGYRKPVPGSPSSGTPRESQVKFRDGTVWVLKKGLVATGPGGSIFGENSFYREPGVQDEGGRHVVKGSSDPRVAHPEVKVQVRDLVRVVDIIVSLPRGASVFGENSFSSPRGQMGTEDLCQVPPAAVYQGKAKQSSGTGPCGY